MKKYKKIVILIILICTLFFFTGCTENKDEELKTKVISELDYINVETLELLNGLNNISFENYSVISQQVKLSDEGQQSQAGEGSQTSNGQGGNSSEGGSGGSSDTKEAGEKQEQEGESTDAVNTTTMVIDAELDKDRNDIDWTGIKKDIELLEESWAIIILDLYALDVKNDIILDFSNKLNRSMIAIKNEDKSQSLILLADLYSNIPEFLEEINADKNMQKLRQTQSHIINAYILAEDIENGEIDDNLTQAVQVYSEIISDIDYIKDKTEKTNKIYVLLNELANSLDEKDSDVFYIKYKNLMKEIQTI